MTPPASATTSAMLPTAKQIEALRTAIMLRKARKRLEILAVDEQATAAKHIINETFKSEHKINMAASAKEAWTQYLASAPDIIYIGIELPDLSGHKLARLIRVIDKDSYIIMVNGNADDRQKDEIQAKQLGMNGFIAKPYDNKKILHTMQQFQNTRKPKKN